MLLSLLFLPVVTSAVLVLAPGSRGFVQRVIIRHGDVSAEVGVALVVVQPPDIDNSCAAGGDGDGASGRITCLRLRNAYRVWVYVDARRSFSSSPSPFTSVGTYWLRGCGFQTTWVWEILGCHFLVISLVFFLAASAFRI